MSVTVQKMFDKISPRYDLANRVLSMGVDPSWRRAAVKLLGCGEGSALLDVATGTGDLALDLARAAGSAGHVTGLDFSAQMLAKAPPKEQALAGQGLAPIDWVLGDALALPFEDDRFDGATIAFGIRNTDDPAACLRELKRVVKPGGAVVVLEFGQPKGWLFPPIYRAYSKLVMPRIGGLITGERQPYEYLPETSAAFPCGEAFAELMREAGLADPVVKPLFFGIAWLYRGDVR